MVFFRSKVPLALARASSRSSGQRRSPSLYDGACQMSREFGPTEGAQLFKTADDGTDMLSV